MKAKIYKLLQNKYNAFLEKIFFYEMVYYVELKRREKRLKAYSKNFMYRRRMRLLFEGWREVSHNWLKERVNNEAAVYEKNKREQELT